MSNSTFKNVKNVAEQLSDLAVTSDVTVHQRLYAKDLIATQVFNIPDGKSVQSKVFSFSAPHAAAAAISGASLDATKDAKIVAAELTHAGGIDTVDIGNAGASADNIFSAAPEGTRRVSSAFSQALGSNGSADPVSLGPGDELFAKASGAAGIACVLTVHYYLE